MTQEVLLSPSLVLKQSPPAIGDLCLLDWVAEANQRCLRPIHPEMLPAGAALTLMAGTAAVRH